MRCTIVPRIVLRSTVPLFSGHSQDRTTQHCSAILWPLPGLYYAALCRYSLATPLRSHSFFCRLCNSALTLWSKRIILLQESWIWKIFHQRTWYLVWNCITYCNRCTVDCTHAAGSSLIVLPTVIVTLVSRINSLSFMKLTPFINFVFIYLCSSKPEWYTDTRLKNSTRRTYFNCKIKVLKN